MLIPIGISNVKYVYEKWGQNKLPKISQIKAIVHFIIQNFIKIIIDIIQSVT